MAEEAHAAGLRAFAELRRPKRVDVPGAAPWAGFDGALLMMRVSKETRRRWYALFDRDPEWCRKAFAEFASAACGGEE